MNRELYLTVQRNELSSAAFLGRPADLMAFTLHGSGDTPSLENKNGCRESPRCDDSDSDDAFEPDEVIIEGQEQSLAGPSGDAVPADRSSESRQGHEQPRANSDTAEYESRQRSRQPGSDRDTERRHAPLDRPRRKTRSTKDTKYKDFICE